MTNITVEIHYMTNVCKVQINTNISVNISVQITTAEPSHRNQHNIFYMYIVHIHRIICFTLHEYIVAQVATVAKVAEVAEGCNGCTSIQ